MIRQMMIRSLLGFGVTLARRSVRQALFCSRGRHRLDGELMDPAEDAERAPDWYQDEEWEFHFCLDCFYWVPFVSADGDDVNAG